MSIINSTTFAMAGPGSTTSTEAGLFGLGLGLPTGVLQSTFAVSATSNGTQTVGSAYPEPIQRPKKPLVGLGFELPTDKEEGVSVRPMIGLGIYNAGWEVVDDREEEEREDDETSSRPLLPARRTSPYHVKVILDDDVFPPLNSIFTPPLPSPSPGESPAAEEYEHTFIRPFRALPPFMCAPSPSELPIPFASQLSSNAGSSLGQSDQTSYFPTTTRHG
ncbi:hypothetical protein EUX98_g4751 [Antrodiella citrinella]|uniref:Uncharacterized protein n=1 Tax=Antrodiella citrinella TaxID=2447956 RepID=A0A4S4MU18_9APHY|nr:hypothetical protein EUX98_g4751 [Antrodiella citrinella]